MSGSWRSTASRRSRSWRATARWCWRPAPGSTPSSMQPPRLARQSSILLHDGRRPARSPGWSSRTSRRSAPRRCRRLRRCRRTACRPGSTSRTRCASICLLGGPPADWVTVPAASPPRLGPGFPRQGRPHRGAGPDQPRRRPLPCSICTGIISGCWTGSTTAGNHSGWIRWRSKPGQTQRIAFAAEYAGRWLMEAMAADWAAPRLVRWYSVE